MKAYFSVYTTVEKWDYRKEMYVNKREYSPCVSLYHNLTPGEYAVICELERIYGNGDGFDGDYDYTDSTWWYLEPEDFDSFKADLKELKKQYHVR